MEHYYHSKINGKMYEVYFSGSNVTIRQITATGRIVKRYNPKSRRQWHVLKTALQFVPATKIHREVCSIVSQVEFVSRVIF